MKLRNAILATSAAAMTVAATAAPTTQSTTRPTTHPATQSVAAPTAPNLQLHECTVFVLDASTGLLNPDGIISATLPAFVTDHRFGSASTPAPVEQSNNNGWVVWNGRAIRASALQAMQAGKKSDESQPVEMSTPQPVGVIRLTGTFADKLDVSLTAKGGTFVGSSPKAEDRPNQVLWRDLTVSDQPVVASTAITGDQWISKLRSAPSDFLSMAKLPSERFLLYDLQMPFPSPLKVKAGKDDSLELTNIGKYPLHEVVLYRDGKEAGAIELDAAEAPPSPVKSAAKPTTTPSSSTTHPATTSLATSHPAITHPVAATAPATLPVAKSGNSKSSATVQLAVRPTTGPSVNWLPWTDRMKAAGVDDTDRDMIGRLLNRYAVDRRLTAVYVMDPDEIDHVVPIEVVPQPAKISRFALVIVVNADPSAGNIVDDLIKQLGDDDWTKRDAAYHALASMGPAATSRLQTASKSADLETAWRAERLLAMNPPAAKP